jgi:ABC-2 type transport system ATP-binding protein
MAGLTEQAGVQSSKLSGGQRQRLYFALAVCGDPELIFLDEPTVGMDVESRRAFLEGIKQFAARGKTILLTTHYLEEADELARRVVVIDQGRVIADAPPGEIKARVAGKRVGFVSPGIAAERLAGLPYSDLRIEGDRVRLLSNEPEALLKGVFDRGIEVSQLEVAGADLEEAFITLTRHPAPEAVAP